MKRQIVLDRVIDIDYGELFDDKDFKEISKTLMALALNVDNTTGETAKFRVQRYGYDGGSELKLDVYREENDMEYNRRMDLINKEKERIEETRKKKKKERAEYERLKAKFGG